MPKQSLYHVSQDNHIHKGPSAKCPVCKRALANKAKTKAEKCKVSGSSGGKKAAQKTNTRQCPCGSKIHHENKSGFCIKCLNEKRRVEKQKKKKQNKIAGPRYCKVDDCSNKLIPTNKSGFCAKCFRKSEHWKAHREEHSNWISSAVFSHDVKDFPSVKRALEND